MRQIGRLAATRTSFVFSGAAPLTDLSASHAKLDTYTIDPRATQAAASLTVIDGQVRAASL